ncbi:MAG: hypothetical protein ACYDCC_04705 [Actinomycetota bacterium]
MIVFIALCVAFAVGFIYGNSDPLEAIDPWFFHDEEFEQPVWIPTDEPNEAA